MSRDPLGDEARAILSRLPQRDQLTLRVYFGQAMAGAALQAAQRATPRVPKSVAPRSKVLDLTDAQLRAELAKPWRRPDRRMVG